MNDNQFQALLGAISQLTIAIRSNTETFKDEMLNLQLCLVDFRKSYEIANEIEIDDLDNFDTPIGGDGE